tara:strand:- start:282 stop:431 length:150 start_codon:yes stop_codon:yes gene_type:complete
LGKGRHHGAVRVDLNVSVSDGGRTSDTGAGGGASTGSLGGTCVDFLFSG